jgi:hypothetical protein
MAIFDIPLNFAVIIGSALRCSPTNCQYRCIKGFSLRRGSAVGGGEVLLLIKLSTSSVFALRQIHLLLKEKALVTEYQHILIVSSWVFICINGSMKGIDPYEKSI